MTDIDARKQQVGGEIICKYFNYVKNWKNKYYNTRKS